MTEEKNKIIFVMDTETTGLHVENNERVLQIALICGTASQGILHKYVFHVNPEGRRSAPEAYAVHGIDFDHPNQRAEKDVLIEIENLMNKHDSSHEKTVIFHNAPFDMSFLKDAWKRHQQIHPQWNVVDTLIMAREQAQGKMANLDAVAKRLNVGKDLIKKRSLYHDALIDCELTFEVWRGLQFPIEMQLVQKDKTQIKIIQEFIKNGTEIQW